MRSPGPCRKGRWGARLVPSGRKSWPCILASAGTAGCEQARACSPAPGMRPEEGAPTAGAARPAPAAPGQEPCRCSQGTPESAEPAAPQSLSTLRLQVPGCSGGGVQEAQGWTARVTPMGTSGSGCGSRGFPGNHLCRGLAGHSVLLLCPHTGTLSVHPWPSLGTWLSESPAAA